MTGSDHAPQAGLLKGRPRILIADDEASMRTVLSTTLAREGYATRTADDGQEALEILQQESVDVLLTDLKMPRMDGLALLHEVLKLRPGLPVVMLTAHGTVDTAVTAMKLGAFDYLTKPYDRRELKLTIQKAAAASALSADLDPNEKRYGMIGQSLALEEVFRSIDKVANSPSTVLVTGESGTGKELIAAALHQHSKRKDAPFIRINCAAIPSSLIESELFGYERGAFTGAVASKPGRFELADKGTLFLDEIGTIPPEMQVKLLRALQESEFERVGGVSTLSVDVRLVAATNADLLSDVKAGRFREDLFYRLNVVSLRLPPLRERQEDIPLLARHFLKKYTERLQKPPLGISDEALAILTHYPWPGNIRELENVIERGVLFAEGDELDKDALPPELLADRSESSPPSLAVGSPQAVGPLKEIVRKHTASLERDLIGRALEETGGNVTQAAKKLEISRKGLQNKIRELGLRDGESD